MHRDLFCTGKMPVLLLGNLSTIETPYMTENPRQYLDSSTSFFFNPFEEMSAHERNLPLWQQDEIWQFITWRLADSIPKSILNRWKIEKEDWLRLHAKPWDQLTEKEYYNRFGARLDHWLDAGHGSCLLRQNVCAIIVANALKHFCGKRYEIGAFVVMPNHVHVLFRPFPEQIVSAILHSWKSFSAKEINKLLSKTGTVWQEEYWDRMIRNERHLFACLEYIEENPKKAKLSEEEYILEKNITPS